MQLVSTFDKYVNSPSTRGLIDLLNDFCEGRLIIDEASLDALDIASTRPHVLTCRSIFDFDEALWETLPRVNLDIEWTEVNLRRSNRSIMKQQDDKVILPPPPLLTNLQSSLSELATAVAETFTASRDQSRAAREKTSNKLSFFAEVNAFFFTTDSFEALRRKASELEQLLLGFSVSKSDKWIDRDLTPDFSATVR